MFFIIGRRSVMEQMAYCGSTQTGLIDHSVSNASTVKRTQMYLFNKSSFLTIFSVRMALVLWGLRFDLTGLIKILVARVRSNKAQSSKSVYVWWRSKECQPSVCKVECPELFFYCRTYKGFPSAVLAVSREVTTNQAVHKQWDLFTEGLQRRPHRNNQA